ncbi:gp53-like domain-containing protein [Escherichia coli]|uniref:gp53-like domain-containing protein n=1 Tax=Escherichia coli TaxID=562 RepID=UPI003D9BD16D
MTSFQSGSNELGTWVRHPSGILIQFGVYPFSSTTGGIRFPTPFSEAPSYCLSPTSDIGVMAVSSGSTPSMISDVRTFNAAGVMQNNGVSWIAIGR